MSPGWVIVAIPGTLVLMAVLLALSALVEQHFLSPRSLILGVVRARRNTPEYAEAFVARQLDLLLVSPRNQRLLGEPPQSGLRPTGKAGSPSATPTVG